MHVKLHTTQKVKYSIEMEKFHSPKINFSLHAQMQLFLFFLGAFVVGIL